MEATVPSRSSRKRPYLEEFEHIDDSTTKPPKQKKVRFPKGKKAKAGDEAAVDVTKLLEKEEEEDGVATGTQNPRLAAKERAKRRNLLTAQVFSEDLDDVSAAEVTYEENENFVEDGIQIEPFNLDKEREEGYFDAAGNFVEYVYDNEVKDAWLDSVAVDPRYSGKSLEETTNEDDTQNDVSELSSEDVGEIKKRIASLLEPGETVLQALRRLKGGSNKKKEKMSSERQLLFDQLTEDANKLLNNGEYNVYHEKQEVFKREAEGYEKLSLARRNITSLSTDMGKELFSDATDLGATSSKLSNSDVGASKTTVSTSATPGNGADEYDMFADDDDNNDTVARPLSNCSNLAFGSNFNKVSQPSSDDPLSVSQTGALQDDYVYDETSGYYYSSSSGYYYDPSTGLYCYATSGQWYSYNEQTGTYDEIQAVPSNAS